MTQSESELKPIEILGNGDTVLVLLHRNIKQYKATKDKPEYWEAEEKQIEMKNFPGIETYLEKNFNTLFDQETIQKNTIELLEKRVEELENKLGT